MSSSSPIMARWSIIVAPFLIFGCSGAGGDGSENGDSPSGCRIDADCRQGRVCLDLDGNRNDICEDGEDCACGPVGTGGTGNSNGGTGGDTNGGSTTGGAGDGGNATGGNATGGNATGGNATGGNTTGGSATGGNATGGNATGGSAGTADCTGYCARVLGAMCSAVTEAACLTDCNALASDCPAETPAVMACVVDPAHPVTCLSGSPVITGCDAQLEAADRCLVCAPATGDMSCATCSKGSCCDEIGDYVLAAGSADFYDCATVCTTQTCFDACVTMFPAAAAANSALGVCQDTSCAEECICEVGTNDNVCSTCAKGSCCAEYVDYVLSDNFADFDGCAADCQDDLCIQDCADTYPAAGAAFGALSDCLYGSCLTECSN